MKLDLDAVHKALSAASVGCWQIEIDDDKTPRLFVDATAMRLLGIAEDAKLTPEETYLAWYDNIVPEYYVAIAEGAARIIGGEPAATSYLWHHPDGRTVAIRSAGTRDDAGGSASHVRATGVYLIMEAESNGYVANPGAERGGSATEVMQSLFEDLDSLFVVDPETGSYRIHLHGITDIEQYTVMRHEGRSLYEDVPILAKTVIHEDDREQFLAYYEPANLRKVAETGVPQEIENRWFVKGGQRVIRNRMVRQLDPGGRVNIVLGVWDVTDSLDREASDMRGRVLQSFGGQVNAATWSVDFRGDSEIVAVHWSDEMRRMFGFESEADFPNELKPWSDRLHPEDSERVMEMLVHGVRNHDSGAFDQVEYRFRRKDGEYRWLRTLVRTWKKNAIERTYYGVLMDITDEKTLAQINRSSEVRHRLMKSAPWSVRFNAKREIVCTEYPRELKEILGNEFDDDDGWIELIHPDDRYLAVTQAQAVMGDQTGSTQFDIEYRFRRKDGEYHWIRSAARVILDPAGGGEVCGICVDIDAAVRLREERQRELESEVREVHEARKRGEMIQGAVPADPNCPWPITDNHIPGEDQPADDANAVDYRNLGVEELRKLAGEADVEAQNRLGVCYMYGEGVPKDMAVAVDWYRQAAERGHAGAQYALGWCFHTGTGVAADETASKNWYRKAAEQGHAGARSMLKSFGESW